MTLVNVGVIMEWRKDNFNPEATMKIVAYYRVSTDKQAYGRLKGAARKLAIAEKRGYSGLGLDAQKEAVKNYAAANHGHIMAEYEEAETGKFSNRPKLQEAIAHAKLAKAKLVIAKLDRLSRNMSMISALMETGVDFSCCDMPQADRLTIHVYAALAEQEARATSTRTREALQQLKKSGVKLGSARQGHWIDDNGKPIKRGFEEATKRSAELRSKRAEAAYAFLVPRIVKMYEEENKTLSQIATSLNEDGHLTTVGKPFNPTTIHRILKRQEKPKPKPKQRTRRKAAV